ncbi:hypothetical protein D3C79_1085980 [compost metagenome]
MIGGAAIEETADRLTRHVVDPGLTAGTDRHEAFLCLDLAAEGDANQGSRQGARQG